MRFTILMKEEKGVDTIYLHSPVEVVKFLGALLNDLTTFPVDSNFTITIEKDEPKCQILLPS